LGYMAEICLSPHDTLLYSPQRARAYAWCAAEQDGFSSPEHLHLLACSNYYCGNSRQAIRWMIKAINVGPGVNAEYGRDLDVMLKLASGKCVGCARRLELE